MRRCVLLLAALLGIACGAAWTDEFGLPGLEADSDAYANSLTAHFPAGGTPQAHRQAAAPGFGAQGIAWKTGTSWGGRDAWAFGFHSRHVVAVWIGRPDGTPLPGASGTPLALPQLARVFDLLPTAPARSHRRLVQCCRRMGR